MSKNPRLRSIANLFNLLTFFLLYPYSLYYDQALSMLSFRASGPKSESLLALDTSFDTKLKPDRVIQHTGISFIFPMVDLLLETGGLQEVMLFRTTRRDLLNALNTPVIVQPRRCYC